MNILQDAWLPFRLKDGSETVLPLSKIIDPNVVDFALPRADFQGAAYQFAIGVLQTAFAPENAEDWCVRYGEAPDENALKTAFEKIAHAFQVLGEGPLFMQDFDPLDGQEPTTVAGLLIEAPGANGIKNNTDHFIKRGIGEVMSLEMAVLALFTLQINAPSGGAGHRVGLRGGGPLTTLVLPFDENASLWQKLWLNVMSLEMLGSAWEINAADLKDGRIFPWLAPTKQSDKKGTEIYQKDVHPLHMYWAMPRRIRLLVNDQSAQCQISGKTAPLTVKSYLTKNYGGNYSGTWDHPLTPYKWDTKKPEEEHLSIKGQPGGIHYKTWDLFTLTSNELGQRCASVVSHYQSIHREAELNEQPRLWVFGFDLDNMKSRGWYCVSMPLFSFESEDKDQIILEVKRLQSLANNALWHTRTQIKAAWFEKPADAKGDTSFIDLAFWQRSESAFFIAAGQVISQGKKGDYLTPEHAEKWLKALQRISTDLFDEYALSELGDVRSMVKRIKARQRLTGWLYGGKDTKNFIADYKIPTKKDVA